MIQTIYWEKNYNLSKYFATKRNENSSVSNQTVFLSKKNKIKRIINENQFGTWIEIVHCKQNFAIFNIFGVYKRSVINGLGCIE